MTSDDPLAGCLSGHFTAEVAIARLLLAGESAAGIRKRVRAGRDGSTAWAELDRLTHAAPLERLRRMLDMAGVNHAGTATTHAVAALFDRAVTESPEASVAMYSLGDPTRLQRSTEEIVHWLCRMNLIGPTQNVLDLGCGIGRIAVAVASHVRWVLGTDLSRGMLQQASARCSEARNVSLVMNSGQNLAAFADGMFDLILAVDSFPYLIQAGVAENHVADAYRILRSKGRLVLLNLSYRNDLVADRADAERWACSYRFSLQQSGISPFRSWDGVAYVFART
jgi:cyclopropane fatty-acyl-phospholipid synthase-like methyltransferase